MMKSKKMITYNVDVSFKPRKRKRLIRFLQKQKFYYFYVHEGFAGFWVRTRGKNKILESFLKKKKYKFKIEDYYKWEGSEVKKHREFFEELFHLFSKYPLYFENATSLTYIFERVAHMFCNLSGFNGRTEAYLLHQLGAQRAFYQGRIEYQQELIENGTITKKNRYP